ncbi:MAG: hypothetical protein NZ108_03940 [Bacteroidia bacterium]|nr:hypothetical protein [Bacteroidia bacterium]
MMNKTHCEFFRLIAAIFDESIFQKTLRITDLAGFTAEQSDKYEEG